MASDSDIAHEIQMPFFTPSRLPSTQLFSDRSLSELFEELTTRINQKIDKIDQEHLLQTPVQDIVEYVIDGTRLEVPTLMYDNRYQLTPVEVKSIVQDYGKSIEVDGFEYRFVVPFEGHLGLFRHFPNTSFGVPPHAGALDKELRFVLHGNNLSKEELEKALSNQIEGIRAYLAVIQREVDAFHERSRNGAQKRIEERRSRILNARNVAASLDFPLRRRVGDPLVQTIVPQKRVTAPRSLPQPGQTTYTPEPALLEAEYQHILKVITDMTLVMERSRKTFAKLDEEELRDFYLVALNGHYEGTASGETFNAGGKTDILIRHDNRNVFIAECKFWSGSQGCHEALDQLLRYLTWRDTKASLIMFSRLKTFSYMQTELWNSVQTHPNFLREESIESETRRRYIFRSSSDPGREVILTVVTFDIPKS